MKAFVRFAFCSLWLACGGGGSADGDAGSNDAAGAADAMQLECVGPEDCASELEICVANECIPANCEDNELSGNESDVDCGGDCSPCTEGQTCIVSGDCMTLFCDAAAGTAVCRDCQTTSDCSDAAGTYCSDGLCVPLRAQSESCSANNECTSGNCVDGVCCDTPCDGACETCSTGVCSAVSDGEDPDGDCPDDGVCGRDGACNGSRGCRLYASGTSCPLNTCSGGQSGTGMCNGAGACVSSGQSCDPFTCNGNACRTSCSSDSHCISGYFCSGSSCVVKRGNGQSCSSANQCQSAFCVDGVCCNSLCDGTCQTCSSGTCSNIPASAGSQPADCPAAPNCPGGSCCGNTGTCNGAGGCTQRANGTQCLGASCVNGILTSARSCNGSGTCAAGTPTSCAPYNCLNGSACRTNCSDNSHCQSGLVCIGSTCQTPLSAGTPCLDSGHCASGLCDIFGGGVCCGDSSCPLQSGCFECLPPSGICEFVGDVQGCF